MYQTLINIHILPEYEAFIQISFFLYLEWAASDLNGVAWRCSKQMGRRNQ